MVISRPITEVELWVFIHGKLSLIITRKMHRKSWEVRSPSLPGLFVHLWKDTEDKSSLWFVGKGLQDSLTVWVERIAQNPNHQGQLRLPLSVKEAKAASFINSSSLFTLRLFSLWQPSQAEFWKQHPKATTMAGCQPASNLRPYSFLPVLFPLLSRKLSQPLNVSKDFKL